MNYENQRFMCYESLLKCGALFILLPDAFLLYFYLFIYLFIYLYTLVCLLVFKFLQGEFCILFHQYVSLCSSTIKFDLIL